MSFHLAQAKHCILTFGTMVMGLFSIVGASTHRTELGWGVLFKACSHDGIKLLVLSAMSHYLVGVCAIASCECGLIWNSRSSKHRWFRPKSMK